MPLPVESVRTFNRFYARYIGALRREFLDSPFSLAEASLLFELAHNDGLTATDVARMLSLDEGYLSRMLRDFAQRGFIKRTKSDKDRRQSHLFLTPKGRKAFEPIDRRQHDKVVAALSAMTPDSGRRLVEAMETIRTILGGDAERDSGYVLRTSLHPGDVGWVVERQGIAYAQEYGWNGEYEALVAEIMARFVKNFDEKRERSWIAERGGMNAGCIFLVAKTKQIAQLRLLFVEPSARGLGIGKRLVGECVEFARLAGYKKIVLWTNDVLDAARHLYIEAGFQLTTQEKHRSFGKDLVGQHWELSLQ